MSGKPRNWFEAALVGAGFPLLLAALILASATPSAYPYPPALVDTHAQTLDAGGGASEAMAIRWSTEMVDFVGWELYLHSATDGISSFGLSAAGGRLPAAARGVAESRLAVAAAALPAHMSYQPQAPPS
ncbi:MAG: hypothetical protein GEU87_15545 [Alphaproteobacteria bacterium]|nr:hypothetical protein [Alphaproteobacteria bacterium]